MVTKLKMTVYSQLKSIVSTYYYVQHILADFGQLQMMQKIHGELGRLFKTLVEILR